MTNVQFIDEAGTVTRKLGSLNDRVFRTKDVLERLVNSENVHVSEWAVRRGKIYITFDAIAELEHLPENEMFIPLALSTLFPNCRISGTLIEIESSELL